MQFTTQIPIKESNHKIDYGSKVVSLGSCFAENMAEKLEHYKFRNTVNPFGIIFQPSALAKIIRSAVIEKKFTEADVFHHNEAWHCFDVHSSMSHAYRDRQLEILNDTVGELRQVLENASHLIVTLGTAWVYKHDQSNEYVANCHKVPQHRFSKELLTVETIVESLQQMITLVHSLNPDCHIIFTVSPVRHIKDGFVENQHSKANLISALHNILASAEASYFPSYEIMMDELRDYRFYAEDMLHPNNTAIDYIWERFKETHIDKNAYAVMAKVNSIQNGLSHRPFNPDTAQHQAFHQNLQNEITVLQSQFPHMKF